MLMPPTFEPYFFVYKLKQHTLSESAAVSVLLLLFLKRCVSLLRQEDSAPAFALFSLREFNRAKNIGNYRTKMRILARKAH
ncbi:hypothetical protein D210916BOD24_17240 [Alteromonas sp. D210916BOD_24]